MKLKNNDRIGMNKQNTHTLNTQRKITLERVSYYENKFKTTPSILPRSPFLWEKFPFSRIKEGRGWLIIHAVEIFTNYLFF